MVRRAVRWRRLAGADRRRRQLKPTTALIVDHQLQPDSHGVAATAREQALTLGCVDAQVLCVDVGTSGRARGRRAHRPLPRAGRRARRRPGAARAHARRPGRDGAARARPRLGRAFDRRHAARTTRRGTARCWASVARSPTPRAPSCGSTPWHDPHNADRRFTRTRLRTEVLPLLEDVLGGGVAEALARTATALREDTETLDELAQWALAARDHRRRPRHRAR